MKEEKKIKQTSDFMQGVKDGLPICFAYIPVALTFGILSSKAGLSVFISTLMSALSFTGTGQFAGKEFIIEGASYFSIALSIFVINFRCFVMSLTLSQRLDPKMSLWKRLIISFGNTDEIFAIAMQRPGYISARYFVGAMTMPYIGWIVPTVIGIFAANIFPASIIAACGIAMHAMFIAIIVPPAKESKPVLFTIVVAAICSGILYWVPFLKEHIDSSYSMLIGTFVAATISAIKFPVAVKEEE